MPTDVTDLTFERDVIERSDERPIIVDLWAPWCGPCRTLGPILEQVVEEADGAVELVKVNVDENPAISAAFQVQSIPAVYALSGRKVVDGFIGALPEAQVREFLDRLKSPSGEQADEGPSEIDELLEAGDEASLRHLLEHEPEHPEAVVALAELLVEDGRYEQATELLARVPETGEIRRVAARARLASAGGAPPASNELDARLYALLERVKDDEAARQEYLDVIESLDAEDPRRLSFRKLLSSRLY